MLVNLTPHPVNIIGDDDNILASVPPEPVSARLIETVKNCYCDTTLEIPQVSVILGQVEGLPDPVYGTTYIVSMPTVMGMAAAGIDRDDCLYPYDQVRDETGRIIGCRALAHINHR